MLRPVQLNREIASYVRDLIMSGQLRGGDAVNIERLAKDLDTSSTPVREALQALRAEGFVRFEPRRGFRVAPLSRGDVDDLFLVQRTLAAELARRASERLDDAGIERIAELQAEMREAAERGAADEVETLNFELHRTINHGAQSPKLAWLLGTVVRYMPRRFYATIPGWLEASLRDHDAIIEGLRQRSGDATADAMAGHIEHARDLLVAHLAEQGFWDDDPAA